jgi:aldose 1-epimerase
MSTESADTEITLQVNDLRLTASPYGASLRGLWRAGPAGQQEPIITGYTGAKGKVGGQGDVLIPFPGRVRAGRYTFEDQTYQLRLNDKEGPNAIHGFLRLVPWETTEQSQSAVSFAVTLGADEHPGYPFALRATVSYSLDEQGMTCRFTIQNTGDRSAPVAAGFHPYFTVGSEQIDHDLLHLPLAATLEFENLVPTGRILPIANTTYDFRQPRRIGETVFNTCYLHPLRDADGLLRLRLSAPDNARVVTVWLDNTFNYVVLYSGDPLPETHRRRALAIEPMSCGSDAFNHPEWGLAALAPGQTFAGTWGVIAEN